MENGKLVKRVRDDENGIIIGDYDVIEVDGECHFKPFFIFMLYEYNKRFSDKEFIKKYINIADGIVYWFESRLDGYMVKRSNVWDYIDWADVDEPTAIYRESIK